MNIEQARFNMIEQQVRPWEVLDERVLDLLAKVPRECYVPRQYRRLAFADMPIPLGGGPGDGNAGPGGEGGNGLGDENAARRMLEPKLAGRVLQALDVGANDRALEIGTGSGYLTACLARLAAAVVSYEIDAPTSRQAGLNLAADGYDYGHVALRVGDAMGAGFARELGDTQFDVIALTASLPLIDRRFHGLLGPGGRMFMVIGEAPAMQALLITRLDRADWVRESLFETVLEPMANAPRPSRFSLTA